MTQKSAQHTSKSLKTFFLYAALVFIVILISLSAKVFFVIQQSTFDGKSQFIIAIVQKGKVRELINFQPTTSTISVLHAEGNTVSADGVGKAIGVIPNVTVFTDNALPQDDPASTLISIALRYHMLKTSLTLFDIAQLLWFSKKLSPNAVTTEAMVLPVSNVKDENAIRELFEDEKIVLENVSIQIINASNQPGVGGRLERVISNMGGNVVSVITSHSISSKSQISYFGEESYTLEKLQKLLGFQVKQLQKETLADIVITIGEESKGAQKF